MASGRAVIATDVGGNRALVGGDGAAGLLVPSEDPVSLAAAMVQIASSPGMPCRLGGAGRSRVEGLYSQKVMVDRYEALYRETLAARG
jgi:glycosyltransferase involved in cell wall biosynthesis